MFQTVDSILRLTQDTESILQNMFIITIYILMFMSKVDSKGVLRGLVMDSSFLKVDSAMSQSGDLTKNYFSIQNEITI